MSVQPLIQGGLRPPYFYTPRCSPSPMEFDVREMLEDTIRRYIERFCRENDLESVWGDPIVGFGDARSPLFSELKTLVHPEHYMPDDILPGATIVVSFYLPFDKDIARSNISGEVASPEFAYATALTNSIAEDLTDTVATDVRAYDYEAELPPDASRIEGDIVSRWSQRHVAYICGMGTYGKNNMIITRSGCCGKFYSFVTNLDVEPDPIPETERCSFKRDGSCGVCMQKCRIKAITPGGFDRWACDRNGDTARARYSGLNVCSKCIVGMPCSFRDPSR